MFSFQEIVFSIDVRIMGTVFMLDRKHNSIIRKVDVAYKLQHNGEKEIEWSFLKIQNMYVRGGLR